MHEWVSAAGMTRGCEREGDGSAAAWAVTRARPIEKAARPRNGAAAAGLAAGRRRRAGGHIGELRGFRWSARSQSRASRSRARASSWGLHTSEPPVRGFSCAARANLRDTAGEPAVRPNRAEASPPRSDIANYGRTRSNCPGYMVSSPPDGAAESGI
jgi:hypothetical protein